MHWRVAASALIVFGLSTASTACTQTSNPGDTVTASAAPGLQQAPRPPHYAEVKQLIEQIANLKASPLQAETQQQLFDRLEELGPDAVPAMIALMDDRRPLKVAQLTLTNHMANAFEGQRHYGPELMVDAIAAELNQITHQDFGFIQNGGTDAERDAAVAGWRAYGETLKPASTPTR